MLRDAITPEKKKVKLDFTTRAKLMERKKVLGHYINHHENIIMKIVDSRSQSVFPRFQS